MSPGEGQLKRLQAHVAAAYANKPFYRKLYDDAGVHPEQIRSIDDLQFFPMISKDQIIRDQQENLPFGTLVPDPKNLARVNLIASCCYMCLSHEDQAAVTEMFREIFEIAGMRSSDLVDIASAYHWVQGGTQMDAAVRALGAAVLPGGPGQTEQRVRVLKEAKVTVLQAFTGYAEELARRFAQYNIDPHADLNVRLLIVGGELRDRAAKERLQIGWGNAAVREYYGLSEAGIIAAECFEVGDGMHISEHCVVEVVDPASGTPVSAGEPGEIVTTELMRATQPFIRFRTGDITEGLRHERCACGRPSARLGRILGRSAEIPRIKGLFIAPAMIERAILERSDMGSWRVIIDRKGTSDRVQLLAECQAADESRFQIAADLVQSLRSKVGITFEVELCSVGTIDEKAAKIEDRRKFG